MAWTSAERWVKRAEYARLYKSGRPKEAPRLAYVPDDVERFHYVPTPCFNCGERGGCRHRPWMLVL